jgi:hypothetical protein
MYLRIINENIVYPYSLQKLRNDNRNVTFPSDITDSMMVQFDMYHVQSTPKPNDYTKNISEGTPILVDGVYYQNWEIVNATESEINFRIEDKWNEIRDIRNTLLQECDWTQLSDISTEIKELWQTYRQQLRDITSQTNAFDISWPTKP